MDYVYITFIILGIIGVIIGSLGIIASGRKNRTIKPPTYDNNIPDYLKHRIEIDRKNRKNYIINGNK